MPRFILGIATDVYILCFDPEALRPLLHPYNNKVTMSSGEGLILDDFRSSLFSSALGPLLIGGLVGAMCDCLLAMDPPIF